MDAAVEDETVGRVRIRNAPESLRGLVQGGASDHRGGESGEPAAEHGDGFRGHGRYPAVGVPPIFLSREALVK